MLDVFGIPAPTKSNISIFRGNVNDNPVVWRKPRGASMVYMLAIGSGTPGGNGFSAAAAAARGSGGGGGGGAMTSLIISASFLPNVLFVNAGRPAGSTSWVSLTGTPTTSNLALNVFIIAFNGSQGGNGTGAAGGAGGTAGAIATIASMPLAGMGTFAAYAGQAGAAGVLGNTAGTNIAMPVTGVRCMGGASGGGVTSADQVGGGITAVAGTYLSEQRPASPAAGSNPGSGGTQLWNPFFSFGGCGGSSSNAGIGGNGGPGAMGSGGGGGGGGTTGGTGGSGGAGIVVIQAW